MKRPIILCLIVVAGVTAFVLWRQQQPAKPDQQSAGTAISHAKTADTHQTLSFASATTNSLQEQLLSLISETIAPLDQRLAALTEILASGTEKEVLAALKALSEMAANEAAHGERTEELRALLAGLSEPMGSAAVSAILHFLTGEANSLAAYDTHPPTFLDALRKGLQYQPSSGSLNKQILCAWNATSDPVLRQRLESHEIPGLYAGQAAQNFVQHPAEAQLYLARLETCPHPDTAHAVIQLADQPQVPLQELGNLVFNWSGRYLQAGQAADLEALLSDAAMSPHQQGLAALALAGSANATQYLPSLEKSLANQPAGPLHDRLQLSVQLIKNPTTN